MSKFFRSSLLMGSILLLLGACNQAHRHESEGKADSSDVNIPVEESSLMKVGEGQSADGKLNATLYAVDSLVDTYQDLYIKLENAAGEAIQEASVQLLPEMKMGMMAHSAPVLQPAAESKNGIFKGGIVFIMPTSQESDHNWTVNVLVGQSGETQNRVSIPVIVRQLEKARTIAFDAGSEGRFFLSLLEPVPFKTGEQSARFTLHRISKNEYPAVTGGYEIALHTNMPDMGHGSDGNENARSTGEGYYEGKLNFSMPGLWEVKAELLKDGKKVSTEPITFKININ